MGTNLYFASLVLMCGVTAWLAFYAWRQRSVPGARDYAALALCESLLALTEILSMLSPEPAQALFWFNTRFIFTGTIAVLFLVFALEYNGHRHRLSRLLIAAAFIIPAITQIVLWSSALPGLWVKHEISFYQSGLFWISDTSARIPGLWFIVHAFYSLLLLLAGIVVILATAWRRPRMVRGQALLLSSGALIALVTTLFPTFNLIPPGGFNPFIPGVGASALLYALAIFRFQFLHRSPAMEMKPKATPAKSRENRSQALFALIFLLLVTGISAIGYLSYKDYEGQFRSQVESQLASIGALKVAGLEDWRTERLADAETLHINPAFNALAQRFLENPTDAPTRAELETWLKIFGDNPQYDRVFLLDTGGEEQISSPAINEPVDQPLIQGLADALSADRVTFLDFYRAAAGGPIHLSLLVPILANQDRHPLGLLVLRVDPQAYLYPFIQQWPVPSASAETLLVRRDGADVVFLNTLRFQSNTALNLRIPLTNMQTPAVKAVMGQTGVEEGIDYQHVAVVADIRPVAGSPWFLVSRINTAEIYVPLQDRLWQIILIGVTLILAGGAGLALVWRQQQVRTYQMGVKAAEALRESEEKFRKAFIISPDAIAISRVSDGRYVSVNQGFTNSLGYSVTEALGNSSQELNIWVNREDREKVTVELQANGIVENFEAKFRSKAGNLLDGLLSAAFIELDGERHVITSIRDITERKQIENELRRQNEYLTALQETTLELLSQMDIEALLENIVRRAGGLMGTSSGFLDLIEPETGLLKPQVGLGLMVESLKYQVELGEGVSGIVWQTGRPLAVKDYDHWSGRIASLAMGTISTVIGVPLLYSGQVIGVLGLGYEIATRRTFEPGDVDILTQFARLAVIAIENARLFSAAQQEVAVHKRGEDLIRARLNLLEFSASHSTEEVLRKTLDQIGLLTGSLIGFYHFVDNDQKTLSLQAWWSTRTSEEFCQVEGEGLHNPVDQAGVWADCVQTKQPIIHNNFTSLTNTKGMPPGHPSIIRELIVPIIRAGLVVAILGVGNKPTGYIQEDVDLVTYFADVAWEISQRKQQEMQILAAQTKLKEMLAKADLSRRALLTVVEDQKMAQEEIKRLNAGLEQRVADRTAQLATSNKELEAFAYSVSHDLRAPLRAIDGFSRILQIEYGPKLDQESLRLLGVVRENTHKMDHLITDLLALSRVGRSELAFSVIDMTSMANSIFHELATPEVLEKFTFSVSQLPYARADPTLIRQVWANLLSNAIKYTLPKEKGIIEINGGEEDGLCTYIIKDNGVGFNPKYTDKLFGLFQRLHKAGEFEGTGVGLAIVQRIVHRHGGQIWGEAQLGAGATFYFTIPERQVNHA